MYFRFLRSVLTLSLIVILFSLELPGQSSCCPSIRLLPHILTESASPSLIANVTPTAFKTYGTHSFISYFVNENTGGFTNSYGVVAKIDEQGNVLWQAGGANPFTLSVASDSDIVGTSDGGVIAVGSILNGNLSTAPTLLKLSSDGTKEAAGAGNSNTFNRLLNIIRHPEPNNVGYPYYAFQSNVNLSGSVAGRNYVQFNEQGEALNSGYEFSVSNDVRWKGMATANNGEVICYYNKVDGNAAPINSFVGKITESSPPVSVTSDGLDFMEHSVTKFLLSPSKNYFVGIGALEGSSSVNSGPALIIINDDFTIARAIRLTIDVGSCGDKVFDITLHDNTAFVSTAGCAGENALVYSIPLPEDFPATTVGMDYKVVEIEGSEDITTALLTMNASEDKLFYIDNRKISVNNEQVKRIHLVEIDPEFNYSPADTCVRLESGLPNGYLVSRSSRLLSSSVSSDDWSAGSGPFLVPTIYREGQLIGDCYLTNTLCNVTDIPVIPSSTITLQRNGCSGDLTVKIITSSGDIIDQFYVDATEPAIQFSSIGYVSGQYTVYISGVDGLKVIPVFIGG